MEMLKIVRAVILCLLVSSSGFILAGCGAHGGTAPTPAGMTITSPQSAAKIAAGRQQQQARRDRGQ